MASGRTDGLGHGFPVYRSTADRFVRVLSAARRSSREAVEEDRPAGMPSADCLGGPGTGTSRSPRFDGVVEETTTHRSFRVRFVTQPYSVRDVFTPDCETSG
jgi:hypothetical protein